MYMASVNAFGVIKFARPCNGCYMNCKGIKIILILQLAHSELICINIIGKVPALMSSKNYWTYLYSKRVICFRDLLISMEIYFNILYYL